MSRAENSERGELLLEVKQRSSYFGRWSRTIDMINMAGGLSLVFGGVFLWDRSLDKERLILSVLMIVGGVVMLATDYMDYRAKSTFRFYTRGVEAVESGEFHPWEEFHGYRVDRGEIVLLAATEASEGKSGRENKGWLKGLAAKLGYENLYFPDRDGRTRSIVARYLARL